jgi:hypothetical protein
LLFSDWQIAFRLIRRIATTLWNFGQHIPRRFTQLNATPFRAKSLSILNRPGFAGGSNF